MTEKQKYTRFGGLQILIDFAIASFVLGGAIATTLNFQAAKIASTGELFHLMELLTFVSAVYTIANLIVFITMPNRGITRQWIITWLFVAFSAEISASTIMVAIDHSAADQIPYIILAFVKYITLIGWFWYSKRANVFYKS